MPDEDPNLTPDNEPEQTTEQDAATAVAETDDLDREKFEATTAERLKAAFGTDDTPEAGDDKSEDPEDPKDPEDPEDPEDADDEPAAPEGDEDEEDEEPDDSEAAADEGDQPSDAPTLPDAYRRSLKAYGWEDEEINQNLRNLGDSFVKTAERIHGNRNAEVQQWAEAGRQARSQQEPQQNAPAPAAGQPAAAQPAQQTGQAPSQLQPVDVEKLKKEYGDDEMVDAIAGPVNAVVESINQILPQFQQTQQAAEEARLNEVGQKVEEFFGDDSLQPYQEFYGDPKSGLNEQQVQAREQVLDTAYNLMLGAQSLQGRQLPLREALEHAHQIAAKDQQASAVRKSVKKEAKARNKGISQRPRSRSAASPTATRSQDAPPKTREELEQRTKERLARAWQR